MEKTFSIGQTSSNHLSIDDPSVSPQHAKIINQGEGFLLKDLGSEQGTFVNGQRITQKHIACGDVMTLGKVELEVIDPIEEHQGRPYWSFIADSSWLSGQEFPIVGSPEDVVSIGRGAQCDIVFAGTHLSRLHAEVTINHSSLTLKDLSSANGTFVNDKKVQVAQLYPGDRVRFDVYSFRVFGPGITLPKSATTTLRALPPAGGIEDKSTQQKQWKSKPTSPGNREELNLYKKHYTPIIISVLVVSGVIAAAVYVVMGILSAS